MNYYESFKKYWIPVYRKQIFKAKFENDKETLKVIKDNIDKNWHLQEYKYEIFKELGIIYI